MNLSLEQKDLLEQLRHIVGPAHVLTHEDPATDLTAWELDWRGRERGRGKPRPGRAAGISALHAARRMGGRHWQNLARAGRINQWKPWGNRQMAGEAKP